ncbi:MAG: glycosyltransferase [Calothrix sp. MO_167.B42]|nr:glycosyltransferase [Calothrix sp. MO_167.B42]
MKIAFLVWRFPVLSEPFILNQITGLIDRGHEVDIYACSVDGGGCVENSQVHPIVKQYHLLEHTYYAPRRPKNKWLRLLKAYGLLGQNLQKNPLKYWQLFNSSEYGNQAKSLKLFYRAIPFLGKGKYDIIHCQFGTLGPVALMLRQAGIIQGKIVTTFRGIDISKYVREQGIHVYKSLFAQGDFFLANCEFFQNRALVLGCNPQKILVHGSGIDCQKFTYKPRLFPEDGRVKIATIGRLVEKKGIEYAIGAVAKVAQTYPNIELNIMGDGPLRTHLQQLITELKLNNIVKLLGWQEQPKIIEILNNSHIFIAPSVTASDGNQDAPVNTLKEAMAMGLPVISTFHGGIPELVENQVSGLLVPERDSDAIANKLNYLISHPQVWQSMGTAGRIRVEEKYDMNKLNDELVEIYAKLLNQKVNRQTILPLSVQTSSV